MALYLNEREVAELLTMDDALSAVESVFKLQATGEATNEPRRRVRAQGSTLMTMSGAISGFKTPSGNEFKGLLGLKCYTVSRGGARFYVSLFDAVTGELLAFIEADKLGQMRTGAASGVATKYLALDDAKSVGIYGTGWQAQSQLAAVCAVRKIEEVKIYSRKPENRERFCQQMAAELGIANMYPVEKPEDAADADILITITSSREPVVLGEWLKPGTHINAAGGNSVLRREVDDEAVKLAGFIAVDSLDQAKIESGEFVMAVEKGLLTWERVKELRHVVGAQEGEKMRGRTSKEQITLFKSLGIAIEDVATAAVVYQKAKEQNAGKEI